MELNEILLAVLLVAGVALCVYLILSLKKLTQSLDAMRSDLHSLIDETIPVVQNMNEIIDHVKTVSSFAQNQVNEISDKIDEVKDRFYSIRHKFSKGNTENQAIVFIHNLRAIVMGINAFIKNLNK